MTAHRSPRAVLLALAAAGATGCADAPTAPALRPTGPNLEVVSPSVIATGITRDVPLPSDVTVTLDVPKSGGHFVVPGTGLRIAVPAGALRGNTLRITVTALAGPMVAYNFEPHGTVFKHPLRMSQSVVGTSYARLPNKSAVEVGYFTDRGRVNVGANQAMIDEFLPAFADLTGKRLHFQVRHFSGYMMSSGRTTTVLR